MAHKVIYVDMVFDVEAFNDVIMESKEAYAMTWGDIYDLTGVKYSVYDNTKPSIHTLMAYCNLFDLDPRAFFVLSKDG